MFKNFWAVNFNIYFKFSGLLIELFPFFWSGLYRLMRKYKDWENEKLGTRRARFLAVRKQDKGAEARFGTHGGRGCNCRVGRIVVRCEFKQVARVGF